MLARFTDWQNAFAHPVTLWATLLVAGILAIAPIAIFILGKLGKLDTKNRAELRARYLSWLVMAPILLVPILLGPGWTILGVLLLSIACYREFARATGVFRHRLISFVVVFGITLVHLAAFDHWYELFVALFPIVSALIACVGILADQPKGYVQRVALGTFGFMLFGCAMGHLAYFANDTHYRAILILIIVTVELNDVFAYIVGKSIGGPKLSPNTSPGKTIAGSLGAVVLTTALAATLAHFVFQNTPLDMPLRLIVLGLIISVVGQLGDLMLSSIKRDIGVKDLGTIIPGHGGLLDRFDSIILVAPAVFHYVGYFVGVGDDQPQRIITGG